MERGFLPFVLVSLGSLCSFTMGCTGHERAPFITGEPTSGKRDASDGSKSQADGGGKVVADARARDGGSVRGLELHVLFVGNSHTYTNDLPSMVREFANEAGAEMVTQSATPGGYSFIEHAKDPNTLAAIKADAWDFVVMQDQQQYPGLRLEEVEAEHLPSAQTLVDAIAANRPDTRVLFFMVWARKNGDEQNCDYYPLVCTFEGSTRTVMEGYQLYAERTDAELASVALAWAAVRADSKSALPADQLWADDGYHPALPGSYLAAAVLAGAMLNTRTGPLSYNGGLDEVVAKYLRSVADWTVRKDKSDPRVTTAERVRVSCDYGDACSAAADAAAVTITLSSDSCDALESGSATVSGRIHTTASCRGTACTTVALGGWHEVPGAVIPDGVYQVHVQVDSNGNGKLDASDPEACETGKFKVGGGKDLVVTALSVR